MPRYRTRAAWHGDEIEFGPEDDPLIPNLSVDGASDTETGLVDARGTPIYRVANPIGFLAKIE